MEDDQHKLLAKEAHDQIDSMVNIEPRDQEILHELVEKLGFKYEKPRVPKRGEIWKKRTEIGLVPPLPTVFLVSTKNFTGGRVVGIDLKSGEMCNWQEKDDWEFLANSIEEYYANRN